MSWSGDVVLGDVSRKSPGVGDEWCVRKALVIAAIIKGFFSNRL